MSKRKILYMVYLVCLILVVGMKFTGSFRELWIHAAAVRENRDAGVMNANLECFRTIRIYLRLHRNPIYLRNLVGNVIPFLPLGYFPAALRRREHSVSLFLETMMRGLSVVLFIELFQLVTGFGYFDVDDIMLNMMGCLAGYCFYVFTEETNMQRAINRIWKI